MVEIIPAIIPKSAEDLKDKLETIKCRADTVHVDFCDDIFAPRTEMFLEAHLMVADPIALIPDLVKAGFSRILIQAESVSPEVFAELIHEWRGSVEIAPSLEIDTSLDALSSFAHELKTVQLMGIAHIGKQGEPFDERVVARVGALHTKYPHLTIAVDGGVNKKNAKMLTDAGAARLVVGSALKEFYG